MENHPFTGDTVHFLYSHCLRSWLPDIDYVSFTKLTQNGKFSLVGLSQTMHLNVCNHKLVITETLSTKNNLLRPCIVSPSSTEKEEWVCCKPAWGLQMVPDVSMCHMQQFCGWDIAYKRLGAPGTIHIMGGLQELHCHRIGIFASNTYGIGGDYPQELLQRHQNVIAPEYSRRPQSLPSVIGRLRSDALYFIFRYFGLQMSASVGSCTYSLGLEVNPWFNPYQTILFSWLCPSVIWPISTTSYHENVTFV